jgi:hypothetical protein
MKRQMVKGLTMLTLIATVALGTAVLSANGQSTLNVRAQIPFEFVVGDQTVPAGEYSVRTISSSNRALMIQNAEASISTFRLANAITPKRNKTEARLVFHRYGQNYFLREVWEGGETTGQELRESKQERAIKREMGAVARNSYELVEIVATLQ